MTFLLGNHLGRDSRAHRRTGGFVPGAAQKNYVPLGGTCPPPINTNRYNLMLKMGVQIVILDPHSGSI